MVLKVRIGPLHILGAILAITAILLGIGLFDGWLRAGVIIMGLVAYYSLDALATYRFHENDNGPTVVQKARLIRMGILIGFLSISIVISVLVSPWFFFLFLLFPFEFLLPWVRKQPEEAR